MKIFNIIGAGVSGSLLASLLTKHSIAVNLKDLKSSYFKPCGDIVPNIYKPKISWKVKYEIKKFKFLLDNELIYDIKYRYPKWIVIDKWGWINEMRNYVIKNNKNLEYDEKHDIILNIYANGPYNMDREIVYTSRALVNVENFDDTAVLEFNSHYTGFFWIFPNEEGIYNVGAGFLEYKDSKSLLLDYINKKFHKYKIIDIRGAPISIGRVLKKRNRIGEARGLVFPLSGEGIRPAAISAEIAYEALIRNKDLNEYLDYHLKSIEHKIEIQRYILNLYKYTNKNLRKSLLKIFLKNEILVDAYLEDKIDLEGIIDSLSKIHNGDYLIGKIKTK